MDGWMDGWKHTYIRMNRDHTGQTTANLKVEYKEEFKRTEGLCCLKDSVGIKTPITAGVKNPRGV